MASQRGGGYDLAIEKQDKKKKTIGNETRGKVDVPTRSFLGNMVQPRSAPVVQGGDPQAPESIGDLMSPTVGREPPPSSPEEMEGRVARNQNFLRNPDTQLMLAQFSQALMQGADVSQAMQMAQNAPARAQALRGKAAQQRFENELSVEKFKLDEQANARQNAELGLSAGRFGIEQERLDLDYQKNQREIEAVQTATKQQLFENERSLSQEGRDERRVRVEEYNATHVDPSDLSTMMDEVTAEEAKGDKADPRRVKVLWTAIFDKMRANQLLGKGVVGTYDFGDAVISGGNAAIPTGEGAVGDEAKKVAAAKSAAKAAVAAEGGAEKEGAGKEGTPPARTTGFGDIISAEPVPGTEEAAKRAAAKEKARARIAQTLMDGTNIGSNIDELNDIITNSMAPNVFVVGGLGSMMQYIPYVGSDSVRVAGLINGIGSTMAFDQLMLIKAASETGGAVGQVSDMEEKMLRDATAVLQHGDSAENIQKSLRKIKWIFDPVAIAQRGEIDKRLSDGDITWAEAWVEINGMYEESVLTPAATKTEFNIDVAPSYIDQEMKDLWVDAPLQDKINALSDEDKALYHKNLYERGQ